jgi:VIT1/CCC1 family predicted Fe2+/Mn2+ transporter
MHERLRELTSWAALSRSVHTSFGSDSTALTVSAITPLVALAGFGYIKGHFMDAPQVRSAIQTVLIIRPAAVAFMIARAIS